MNKKNCILCDLDGVFIDSTEWDKHFPKENTKEVWVEFQGLCKDYCKPNELFISYFIEAYGNKDVEIIFFTAREETEYLRKTTIEQIEEYSNNFFKVGKNCKLVMRPENNFIEDYEVKDIMLQERILPYYNVLLAIDDKIDNINMYMVKHNIKTYWYTDLLPV